ncbi:MAG: hypothetical protein KatS3mg016_1953 [Fimbriimonadales bacterium]|nr:MAG: hypothetical protein KatS3mg016_1953 [Fimbriimonadales bacterium]
MADQPTGVRWQVHLAKRQPERLPVILLALVGAPVLGAWLMGHWIFGLVAFWMLWSATADFLLPIRYEADAEGVRQRGWSPRVMRWEKVKRVVWGEDGVLLSPFAHPSRLNAYRGVFLWYGDQRAVVEALVRTHCAHALGETKPKRKKKRRADSPARV